MKKEKLFKIYRIVFALIFIVFGLFFENKGIGKDFLEPSWSLGSWLIFVGFLMIAIVIINSNRKTKKIVDERVQYIGMKASKITFLSLIIIAFFIMIIYGIKPIVIPYRLFLANLISGLVFIYFISYKIIERKN